jgi:tRNA(fMet)-specific endonuclease VapC
MAFLLDTNACIRILNNSHQGLVDRLRKETPASVLLCSVVKAELLYGARKSGQVAKNLTALERFFAPLESVAFDDEAAEHYGLIRADLSRDNTPIGANDLQIAAIARAHDLTVVTNNTREFRRIVGLRVEDWESEPGFVGSR